MHESKILGFGASCHTASCLLQRVGHQRTRGGFRPAVPLLASGSAAVGRKAYHSWNRHQLKSNLNEEHFSANKDKIGLHMLALKRAGEWTTLKQITLTFLRTPL